MKEQERMENELSTLTKELSAVKIAVQDLKKQNEIKRHQLDMKTKELEKLKKQLSFKTNIELLRSVDSKDESTAGYVRNEPQSAEDTLEYQVFHWMYLSLKLELFYNRTGYKCDVDELDLFKQMQISNVPMNHWPLQIVQALQLTH
jgi:hypothetical protein